MKCYECAKDGNSSDAVAVCAVCGMGLCMDHAIEKDVPLVQRTSGWVDHKIIHILCSKCAAVKSLTS
ncbi:Uncharacterized protein SAMN02745165_03296 [Malonomonas rubra DSM 5091]|jgi:hypothetical protein|uniref:DUF2180 family protein n=1 Tax=Malonomonas rubra DSM 5091 TaxID=1122189 RepID=A0A1M6MIA7_MALRU|nr:Uncharacterized protein SAMN02745165_03296 [Malonomonas rubra DSM 5091]